MVIKYFSNFSQDIEAVEPIKEQGYEMPTRSFFGRGAIYHIPEFMDIKDKKIVLILSDHLKNSNIHNDFKSLLSNEAKDVFVYDESIIETNFGVINRLVDFCRTVSPDIIISIGGGTILDAGKCASVILANGGYVDDYLLMDQRISKKAIFFVAIPTTAGTGSEVTPWATVWDKDSKKKYSLSSLLMFPALAIIDPALIDDLPAKITADTGMDALAQAIESYWSVHHNPISDVFALQSIQLIMSNLEDSVSGKGKDSKDNMAKASLLTGLAFSNTKTTICHSISYPITAHFGVAHGQAVALTLSLFVEYILPVLEGERRVALLNALGVSNEKQASESITSLMTRIGMKTRLTELGIKEEDIDIIVKEGFSPDRANNSPRVPSVDELTRMLVMIF
ncbi:MAG: iron-containing alcohol dehydrogenase [Minisyncoccus archaeiphilus]|uniref:iron-containing alcohol dehydrogenase n=1 Tax=Minisyncoccus archaeiphilus TaxID=3238481 RepID=UPI002B0ED2D3|nr:MAG: iron-containing alcohol dehydrogenase [Candidatus Parcubacteria bacterium]